MRTSLTVVVLVALASVARAELTVEEKVEIEKLLSASERYQAALRAVSRLVEDAATPEARVAVAELTVALADQSLEVASAVGRYLHGGVELGAPPPEGGFGYAHPPHDRAAWIAAGRAHLDAARANLAVVDAAALAASAFVDTSKVQSNLSAAAELVAAFDDALAFADPLPAQYPFVAGPHGDYDQAQYDLGSSLFHLARTVQHLATGFANGADAERTSDALAESANCWDGVLEGIAANAAVPAGSPGELFAETVRAFYSRTGTDNRFKKVMMALSHLQRSAPAAAGPALAAAIEEMSLSWWQFDQWMRTASDFIHFDPFPPTTQP